jgi:hypothetical protein
MSRVRDRIRLRVPRRAGSSAAYLSLGKMSRVPRPRLSYANVVASLALFVALGGSSYAVIQLSKGSVKTRHIAKNAVTTKKVRDASLLAQDFAPNQLPQGPKGDTGGTGPQGPKGDTGPQGIPGPVDTSALRTKVAKSGDTLTGMVAENGAPGESLAGHLHSATRSASSSGWFAASACTATAEGHQANRPGSPSPAQHRSGDLAFYIQPLSRSVFAPPDDTQRPASRPGSPPPRTRSGRLGGCSARACSGRPAVVTCDDGRVSLPL